MDQVDSQSNRIKLHPSGPTFSSIVAGVMKWGVWGKNLSTQEMFRQIETCLSLGISTFDHADIYGDYTTEKAFGEALKLRPGLRRMIELVSKCGVQLKTSNRPHHHIKSYNTSATHIIQSAEQSLLHLGTDYLDLFLIHRPSPIMDADEIAQAFTQLKESGKVRHFGVSNFSPAQYSLINDRFPLVTNQVQASASHLAPFVDGTFDQAQRLRCSPMAWSPLGGAKFFEEQTAGRIFRLRQKIKEVATRFNALEEQLLLAWLFKHPSNIIPILGTTRKDRLLAAVHAQKMELDSQTWFEIWEASIGEEVP